MIKRMNGGRADRQRKSVSGSGQEGIGKRIEVLGSEMAIEFTMK